MQSELFLSPFRGRLWGATRQRGRIVELRAEGVDAGAGRGRVVLARVADVLPGIDGAFLRIAVGEVAFLRGPDLLPRSDEPLARRLPEGTKVLVQVDRVARRGKRARVTTRLQFAGRRLVLRAREPGNGVSRRIADPDERSRLARILERLPQGLGWVARTAAAGAASAVLEAEARRLQEAWGAVETEARARGRLPRTLRAEPDLIHTLLRDAPIDGFGQVVVAEAAAGERVRKALEEIDPEARPEVRIHRGRESLFESLGIDREVDAALSRRVALPSGGSLAIEETEALVSIDVNTGRHRGSGPGSAPLTTNLEAAREIPRQLRLRGSSGIIVIDWIDLASPAELGRIREELERSLAADPARTKVIDLSEIGLLQLTRERLHAPLSAWATEPCPACAGSGRRPRGLV